MTRDKEFILRHIKHVFETELVVFITEPIELETLVDPLPYYRKQNCQLANISDDGSWELTSRGWWMAEGAISNLEKKAAFWTEHSGDLKDFWDCFKNERDALTIIIEKLREERKNADFKESPILFKIIKQLLNKRNILYQEMYKNRFGSKYYLAEPEMCMLIDEATDKTMRYNPFECL